MTRSISCILYKNQKFKKNYIKIKELIDNDYKEFYNTLLKENFAVDEEGLLRDIKAAGGNFDFTIQDGVGIISSHYDLRYYGRRSEYFGEEDNTLNKMVEEFIDHWKDILAKYFSNEVAIINEQRHDQRCDVYVELSKIFFFFIFYFFNSIFIDNSTFFI